MNIRDLDAEINDVIIKWDLFRKAPIGVYIIQNRRFKAVNKEFVTYTGYAEAELLHTDPLDIVSESYRESVQKNAVEMLKAKRDKPYEYVASTKTGEDIWVIEAVVPTELDGERAVIGFFMDIDKIVNESFTDALTGLYNRRYFNETLKSEAERSRRYGSYLSLVIFDVDHFKRYNDTYGHTEGDRVLSKIGDLLKGCIRQTDAGCRYGGEEFAVILPQTGLDRALLVAERIREIIASRTRSLNNGVTISAGVSQFRSHSSIEDLISVSDNALYEAKRGGRNRVSSL